MNDAEFLDKFDVCKPRQDDANVVFYGLSAGESAPAVKIAHELGFKWFAQNSCFLCLPPYGRGGIKRYHDLSPMMHLPTL